MIWLYLTAKNACSGTSVVFSIGYSAIITTLPVFGLPDWLMFNICPCPFNPDSFVDILFFSQIFSISQHESYSIASSHESIIRNFSGTQDRNSICMCKFLIKIGWVVRVKFIQFMTFLDMIRDRWGYCLTIPTYNGLYEHFVRENRRPWSPSYQNSNVEGWVYVVIVSSYQSQQGSKITSGFVRRSDWHDVNDIWTLCFHLESRPDI